MQQELNIWCGNNSLSIVECSNDDISGNVHVSHFAIMEKIERLAKYNESALVCVNSIEETLQFLQSNLKHIRAAGCLVRNENNEVLMIHRLGKWDLPKGKIEINEDNQTAAVREVEEETGLQNCRLGKWLCNTIHLYMHLNNIVVKTTHWYAATALRQKLFAQREENIEAAEWVKADYIDAKLEDSYPTIREVFAAERK